jgi:predicted HNH restriction endonuclease
MIEVLTILLFILVWMALYQQWDNKANPKPKVDTRKSFEEFYPNFSIATIYDTIAERKQAYLKSFTWHTLRKQVLHRDHYTCRDCGITGVPLEVHHITYERFEHELLSDLVSVCRDCHQAIHNHYGYDYKTKFNLLKGKPHNDKKWN